ncbi:MAG: hypothetical protein WAK17_20355 [Candidatus Nitrosopolaris sp.]
MQARLDFVALERYGTPGMNVNARKFDATKQLLLLYQVGSRGGGQHKLLGILFMLMELKE